MTIFSLQKRVRTSRKLLVVFAFLITLTAVSPFGSSLAHAQTAMALSAEQTATANYLASPTVTNKNILLSAMSTVNTGAQAPGNVPPANAQSIEQAALAAINNTPAPAPTVNSMAPTTATQVVQTAQTVANPTATPAPAATTPAPAASVSTGNNFIPLTSIPAITSLENSTSNDLSGFFNSIYKICIGVAATLAVLQIIRAGIMYMGGDSITETKQARAMIISSIGGLVLVLSPAVVFGILNPNILSLQIGGNAGLSSLAPPPLSSGSGSAASTGNTSSSATASTGNTTSAPTNTSNSGAQTSTPTNTNQYQINSGEYLFLTEAVGSTSQGCWTLIGSSYTDLASCQAVAQSTLANATSQHGGVTPPSSIYNVLYNCVIPPNGAVSVPSANLCSSQPYFGGT